MLYEIVHLTHDNLIGVILTADGVAYDITNTTRMTLSFDDTVIDSDLHSGVFDWDVGDGKLYLTLGAQTIIEGPYTTELTVYDSVNTNGIVWGRMTILVK